MTSQVPYLEDFIGPPHVFTINTHSRSDIDDVMQRTSSLNFRPFVPHEFSTTGFLERLNFYIELQNFSSEKASSWPSEHLLRTRVGDADESCVDACKRQHLTCEPSFFHFINNKDSFTRLDEDLLIIFTVHAHHFCYIFSMNISCSSTTTDFDLFHPSFIISSRASCVIASDSSMFSCASSQENVRRLCPCRHFRQEQIALWG